MALSISGAAWTLAKKLTPAPLAPLAKRIFRVMTANKDWTEQEELILHLIVPSSRGSVDIGANVGSYTRLLSKLTPFVHAYEPDKYTAEVLAGAGLSNVTVHNKAVSDRAGNITFRVPIVDGQRAVTVASVAKSFENKNFAEQIVQTATLDELADEDIGFVKIDVEGHELEVLHGSRKIFQEQRPIVLIEAEEQHRDNTVEDVKNYFKSICYSGIFIYNKKAYPIAELTSNMMDVREMNKPASKRLEQRYVNNFIFFPSQESASNAIDILNGYLQKKR